MENYISSKNENWYAMYVRMHHEKKTAETLQKIGVKHFLPVQEVIRQWSDRKKKVKVVIIPMMIFIKTNDKTRIQLLNDIPALTGTLIDKSTHRPAVIRDAEMEQFMFMLDYSEDAVNFMNEPLQPGEKVEVIKGPLKGLQGELLEFEGKSQVTVQLNMIGYAAVDMPIGYIKKITN